MDGGISPIAIAPGLVGLVVARVPLERFPREGHGGLPRGRLEGLGHGPGAFYRTAELCPAFVSILAAPAGPWLLWISMQLLYTVSSSNLLYGAVNLKSSILAPSL